MTTTRNDILEWFDYGLENKATYMIVVCDSFDHEDYPVYVYKNQEIHDIHQEYNGKNMQRVMEVYDLSQDKNQQLNEVRCNRMPPKQK